MYREFIPILGTPPICCVAFAKTLKLFFSRLRASCFWNFVLLVVGENEPVQPSVVEVSKVGYKHIKYKP